MTDNEIELEIKVIIKFLNSAKRDRYVNFIKNKKDRIKSIGNIKDCYVISENKNIDQKRMSIENALIETIGADQGTLLVFGNAEIVYSEAEGFNNRWISKKRK